MCFCVPFYTWRMSHVEIGRRLFTEVLAEDGEDGSYVRQTLKDQRPGLWRGISSQLYKLGYDFPEINELRNGVEFATGFTKL